MPEIRTVTTLKAQTRRNSRVNSGPSLRRLGLRHGIGHRLNPSLRMQEQRPGSSKRMPRLAGGAAGLTPASVRECHGGSRRPVYSKLYTRSLRFKRQKQRPKVPMA